jgi:NitT/TauT family transport system permease protein
VPRGPIAFGLRLVFIAALLGVSELLLVLLHTPSYLLPRPSGVVYALYNGFAHNLFPEHIAATVGATLLGFVVACALAFFLGIIVALSHTVEYYFYPLIVMFQAVPKVAFIPLMAIWFHMGLTSSVLSAALVAFFPLMVNTIVGLRAADEDRVNLMRSLAASRWQIFRMLQVPNSLPYVFAGLEVAMILALIGVVLAEILHGTKGLGMLFQSWTFSMDTAGAFSILFILAVLGLSLNRLVTAVRRQVLFWDRSRDADAHSESSANTANKGDVS